MKKGIKILTSDCCDHLLGFTKDNFLRRYYNTKEFDFGALNFLNLPTKYRLDDTLDLNVDNDCDSSIQIFEALNNLDRVQANDRRLWVAMTHTKFFKYTVNRWNIDKTTTDRTIIDRFHFEGSGLATRMRNSISRLWWAAKLTHDESLENPYKLTRILWSKQDLFTGIFERSYGTYENVVKSIVVIYDSNPHLTEGELRMLHTGLNAVGGVKLLALLSMEDVSKELKRIADYNNIKLEPTT